METHRNQNAAVRQLTRSLKQVHSKTAVRESPIEIALGSTFVSKERTRAGCKSAALGGDSQDGAPQGRAHPDQRMIPTEVHPQAGWPVTQPGSQGQKARWVSQAPLRRRSPGRKISPGKAAADAVLHEGHRDGNGYTRGHAMSMLPPMRFPAPKRNPHRNTTRRCTKPGRRAGQISEGLQPIDTTWKRSPP